MGAQYVGSREDPLLVALVGRPLENPRQSAVLILSLQFSTTVHLAIVPFLFILILAMLTDFRWVIVISELTEY